MAVVTPGSKARHHINGPRHAVGGLALGDALRLDARAGWRRASGAAPPENAARDAAPVVVGGRLWSAVVCDRRGGSRDEHTRIPGFFAN